MVALVSLVCPSCGGKLKVAQNVTSIVCQYCGTEHMVKYETNGPILLEAYARCPVCGRNDRAEKVSAVIASQSHEITGVEQKTEEITNPQGQKQIIVRDVPFTRKQVSILGQRLVPPIPPDPLMFPPFPQAPRPPSKRGGISLLVIGVISVVLAVCCGLFSISMFFQPVNSYQALDLSNPYVLGLAIGGAAGCAFLLGCGSISLGIILIVRASKPNMIALKHYQEQVEMVNMDHARIKKSYEDSAARWKQLYYCARDDCIFIPGENTSASVSKMKEYIAQAPQKSRDG